MSDDEFFKGMVGVIQDAIMMGVRLKAEDQFSEYMANGLATNVAAQIMQNIKAKDQE